MQKPPEIDDSATTAVSDATTTAGLRHELLRLQGGGDPFAAAVRGTTLSMAISDPRQPDNPIVFVNDAFLRLTGYERHEVVGRNCRFLQGPVSNPSAVRRIRMALAAAQPIEIDLQNIRKDGTPFWNRLMLAPVRDPAGDLAFFFASQRDVTMEREHEDTHAACNRLVIELEDQRAALNRCQKTQARLDGTQRALRLAMDAAEIGTWDVDIASGGLTISRPVKLMFGISPEAAATRADLEAQVDPLDRASFVAAFTATIDLTNPTPYNVTCRIVRLDNHEVRRLAVSGQGLFDPNGTCERAVGIIIDITHHRATENLAAKA